MKKLLLTLLLLFTLGLAAKAAETVTVSFESTESWSNIETTGNTNTVTATNNGLNFEISNGYWIQSHALFLTKSKGYITLPAFDAPVEKIEITGYSGCANAATVTVSGSGLTTTTTAKIKSTTVTVNVNATTSGIQYKIAANSSANAQIETIKIYLSKTETPTECPVPVFSVADGANVYPGSVITVDKKGATTCELYLGEEKLEGDSYTVPETAEIGSTITLTAKSTLENGNPDNASATITVTVAEAPLEALFDFVNEANTTYKNWPSGAVTNTNQNETVTINGVTLHATGRLTVYSNDLRLYAENGSSGYGSINISVPDGYYLTNIEIDGSSLDKIEYEAFTNTDITVREKTYTHVTTTGTVTIKTINVKYAKIPDPTLDGAPTIEVKHGPFGGVLTVNCDFYIKNYNNNTVEVVATVDGMPEVVFAKVETPNAPARAAAESTRYTTTLKATHENLKGATPTVNVVATIDGKNLFTVAKGAGDIITTGIEDVTVEGEGEAEYYNMQGLRVAQPEAGQLYIKRQGGKAVKVRF